MPIWSGPLKCLDSVIHLCQFPLCAGNVMAADARRRHLARSPIISFIHTTWYAGSVASYFKLLGTEWREVSSVLGYIVIGVMLPIHFSVFSQKIHLTMMMN